MFLFMNLIFVPREFRLGHPSQVDCPLGEHLCLWICYPGSSRSPGPLGEQPCQTSRHKLHSLSSNSEEILASNFFSVYNFHSKHVCTSHLSAKTPRVWGCMTGLGSSMAVLELPWFFSCAKKIEIGPSKYHETYCICFLSKDLFFMELLGINLHYAFCM